MSTQSMDLDLSTKIRQAADNIVSELCPELKKGFEEVNEISHGTGSAALIKSADAALEGSNAFTAVLKEWADAAEQVATHYKRVEEAVM